MKKEIIANVYDIIKDNRGVTFTQLCKSSPHHEHSIRKALKRLTKKGVVSFAKVGNFKHYFTMHELLRCYTKPERDKIYYNYLIQYEFGVTLNKVSKDLKMDKRSFRKDIQRLIASKLVTEEVKSKMIIYKVVGKWKNKGKN